MRVLLTGATGFVGSHLVPELIGAGHRVVGLTRSDAGARALTQAGAEPLVGGVGDLRLLAEAAAGVDGVIHTAFDHDPTDQKRNSEAERRAIAALGRALSGSERTLVVTSGTGLVRSRMGGPAMEADEHLSSADHPRAATEEAADAVIAAGGRVAVVRLPQVHDARRQGRITWHVELARRTGQVAIIDGGRNRVPAVHVSDAVRLYRLALERGEAGARLHAVAEEGVTLREIAHAIGDRLSLPMVSLAPQAAADHFGWLAPLAAADLPASGAWTQERLGWMPTEPGLLTDLRGLDLAGRP